MTSHYVEGPEENSNENYVRKKVVDCRKGLLTVMVGIKTLTNLNTLLRGNIDLLVLKSLVSWEVIMIRTNFSEK